MKTLLKRICLCGLAAVFIAAPSLRAAINSWVPIEASGTEGAAQLNMATLPATASSTEKLYAAWVESGGPVGASQLRIGVYVPGSPAWWKPVDGGRGINFNASVSAFAPRLVVHQGNLFATWYEYASIGQIRVARYNGADDQPGWTFIDGGMSGGLNFDSRQSATSPRAVSFGGQVVVFWTETAPKSRVAQGAQLRARAYNGIQWTWLDGGTAAGLNVDPMLGVENGVPAVVNSRLYVVFRQSAKTVRGIAGPRQLRVKVHAGGSTWSPADGNRSLNLDPNRDVVTHHSDGDGSALYCAWTESNAAGVRQVRVARYDGSNDSSPSWVRLDGMNPAAGLNYDAGGNASNPGIQSYNGKIYVTWTGLQTSLNRNIRRMCVWDGYQWAWADGGGELSNVHQFPNSHTNSAAFGVYNNHLLLWHREEVPADGGWVYPSTMLVGLETP